MPFRLSKVFIYLGLPFILLMAVSRSVVIENVLTGAVEQDFTVHISLWRILFEPVVGPVLFYMRSNQPLLHYLSLFVWILVLTFGTSFYRGSREKRVIKRLILWLKRTPFLVSVFIALLVFMIFVPIPANTITSTNHNWIFVNVHSHSYYSHDGIVSPKALSRWHRYHGFDAFFLTEHNHHKNTLALLNAETDTLPDVPLMMCGQEYSGSNHILLLGLERPFETRDMPDSVAIDSAHAQNGVAIVAHWFADRRKPVQHYIDAGADGFEIINQSENLDYDRELFDDIKSACFKNGLLLVGSTDYHGYGNVCMTWTSMRIPYWHLLDNKTKRDSILYVLRHRRQDRIKVLIYRDRPAGISPFFSPVLNVYYYFRSLNPFQLLSWLVWAGFLLTLTKYKKSKLDVHELVTGINGLWILIWGVVMLFRSIGLSTNKVLLEYGLWLFVVGLLFILYSFFVLKAQKKLFFLNKF